MEAKDSISARKAQKADREKLRRDRLNEQFIELGNTLDPDRPKNDKVTILVDTTQMLKDLTAQVDRLKAECSSLTEESREEKNELRDEKASLKADIENLNIQYRKRLSVMFPWTGIDPSVVVAPPYSYPVPLPIPTRPLAMQPSLQPYPFFGNHNPGFASWRKERQANRQAGENLSMCQVPITLLQYGSNVVHRKKYETRVYFLHTGIFFGIRSGDLPFMS
ncbi:hypothetical protein V6N13_072116 [Hibiscus sabdariffa]|uniref:BHLH domain-containing protein n=1 Tax=Hibiscus sabdariffa TaxID=183260 RepID=A0ABR2TBD9_9ROSI